MLTQDKIAALKAAHGPELSLFEVDALQIVCRPMDLKAWRNFKRRAHNALEVAQAGEELLLELMVHPAPAELRAFLERKPLAVQEVVDSLCKEAGALTSWQSQQVDAEGNERLAVEELQVTIRPIEGVVGRLYQKRLDDPKLAPQAGEWLLEQAVVSPPWADLIDACRGRLLLLDRLAAVVAQRAGRAIEVRAKKL